MYTINSTDTSHKVRERFTTLTDIQLDIYDTTIVRIETFRSLVIAAIEFLTCQQMLLLNFPNSRDYFKQFFKDFTENKTMKKCSLSMYCLSIS